MSELLNLIEKDAAKGQEVKPLVPTAPPTIYPTVEDMQFRAIINSEAEGLALLRAIQILVNELGAGTIVGIMKKVEANPSIIQQLKAYLPYFTK